MKRNEIQTLLHDEDIDCLGITEANLGGSADMEEVEIPGYVLRWDAGRENPMKNNSRVVVYVKEELNFELVRDYMKDDLMPEIWLRLGHKGTRRTLVGFIYREHKTWNGQDDSVREQGERLQKWLDARERVWRGTEEAFLLGDINLDMLRVDVRGYSYARMKKMLEDELTSLGWVQLIKSHTHYVNRAGVVSQSLIDHIWTNTPVKVEGSGQVVMPLSDHHLIWVERRSKNLVERVKRTEKRSMKDFCLEDLEQLCRQEDWRYLGVEPRTEDMLEKRVQLLEDKINNILERVAPMRIKKMSYRGKPRWMTPNLVKRTKERLTSRKKANRTKDWEDEKEARRIRNEVNKEVKNAQKEFLRRKLENLAKNSPDSWAAVGEFLGWRKPVSPTMLVQDGKVLTGDQELAETMLEQFKRKEREVEQALGEASGDCLAASRRMSKGNKAIFNFRKVSVKEVEKQITKVDNKESFGHDKISYGFLKKMKRWIVVEIMEIINLSLEVKRYPSRWKIARVKPLYKSGDCDRQAPKSFRPVALLAAISRITEALLAKQLDDYQEEHGLIHKGVHGFRRGRGTHTAMLETWEYVMEKTQKGELVALDLLDTSAAFDTMVHFILLRKMEVEAGMGENSLEWLASYLEGWLQYVVVGASSSSVRKMTRGAPQGGGKSPNLFRSYLNVIPEAGLVRKEDNREQGAEGDVEQHVGVISRLIDVKKNLTTEERLDQKMRIEGKWDLVSWRKERTGEGQNDRLHQKPREEEGDVVTTIYADDTQSRTSAKTLVELERQNSRGLTEVCKEMKTLRLKVNEDKTVYMILATSGRRRQENLESEIEVCEEKVKSSRTGKCLGLIVSDNLSWERQVTKVVESCQKKQRGLWKCTGLMRRDQRKTKAEGVVLSRLNYCIEVVSQGRQKDLEKLQSVQSAAARWVLQTRKKDWSLTGGLRKLGWLSMAQQAAYTSIRTAMRVLQDRKPERLYDTLTEQIDGVKVRKTVQENRFKGRKLLLTTKKSWSNRSLRWLEQMPEALRRCDVTLKSSKTELKRWVKHHIPVRGDRIMWGRALSGEMRRRRAKEGGGNIEPDPPSSPREEEERQEISEGNSREEGRIGGDAGRRLLLRRGDEQGSGQEERSKGRNYRLVILLLLLLIRSHVATSNVQVDRISLKERLRGQGRRKVKIWRKSSLGGLKRGGHLGGMGRVSCGEG